MFQYIILLLVYGLGYALSEKAGLISFALMAVAGVAFYFYYANKGEKNFFRAKAVFSASWLITIGASQLRLLEYQNPWEGYTWINVAVGHLVFFLANDLATRAFPKWEERFSFKKINDTKLPVFFGLKKERLFWVALVTALLGLASFALNVSLKGYIPFFVISKYPTAYLDFYTRIHTFTVASMASGGLAYYCLKKLDLPRIKRVVLYMIIGVMVFLIPILLVQRGTFITTALILASVVYFLSNKKFHVALLCIVLIFGVYMLGSSLRGYTDQQLSDFFQPKEIEWGAGEDPEGKPLVSRFKIPSKVAFLYSYLTVSHDNFNLLLDEKEEHTWGLWQLQPFNVVFRSAALNERIEQAEAVLSQYRMLPHLNTYNLIAFAFYDFGVGGVVLFMFLWSFAFGLVETFLKLHEGPFAKLAYGVILTPVAMSFMNPWLSLFSVWLLWGTILLMFLASTITLKRKEGINA